jgi:cold shock CspA family protein
VDATGHVFKLFVGHGHGFIRASFGADVFFHRSDVQAGQSINDFGIGDAVAFELLLDRVSGPRALRVRRCTPELLTVPGSESSNRRSR